MSRALLTVLAACSALALAGCRSEASGPTPASVSTPAPDVQAAKESARAEGRLVLAFTGDNGGEVAPCG